MFETFGSSLAPLVVRAVALLVLIADGAVCQSPSIDFRWRLLEHFGALKSDGSMIDFHWNASAAKYDPAYVSPPDGWVAGGVRRVPAGGHVLPLHLDRRWGGGPSGKLPSVQNDATVLPRPRSPHSYADCYE